MTNFYSLIGNYQKLDGGAMFGNVPKSIWNKWIPADETNRIQLSNRALLVQLENKNILLEAGIGAFFNPHLKARYGVEESKHVLLESLENIGLSDKDIDIIILSHLHFDHAGGLLSTWSENEPLDLLFPNARYIVSKLGWERACNPHPRDKASFIPELNQFLLNSGRLEVISESKNSLLGNDFHFMFTDGHTVGLMHTVITTNDGPIIFVSDLIPGVLWVHLPVSMGYDRAPEILIDEKKKMLDWAISHNARLFYTHDPQFAMSRIIKENGKYAAHEKIIDFCSLAI